MKSDLFEKCNIFERMFCFGTERTFCSDLTVWKVRANG